MRKSDLSALIPILTAFVVLTPGLSLNQAQFGQRLKSEVSLPFSKCMSSYNVALTDLSKLLAAYKPQDVMPPAITPQLTTAVNSFVANIKTSSTNSHALAQTTSQAVAQQSNLVSQEEVKIQQNANQIKQNKAKVTGEQQQVRLAESALSVAQKNLRTYQGALQSAKDRYDHAKSHCIFKKRRKRDIWKHIGHIIRKTVDIPKKIIHETQKGICKTLNLLTRQITKAKHDVSNAENRLNAANTQLKQKKNNLAATQGQLSAHQKQQTALNSKKNQLQAQLSGLKASRDQIQGIDEKMKRTVSYIDGIKSRGVAAKLVVDLGYLIDPANLVQPLTEIGKVMKGLTGQPAGAYLPTMSPAQMQGMLNKIKAIKAKIHTG